MRPTILPISLCLVSCLVAANLPFGVFQVNDGKRLLGSSFGAFATPSTFDYVVSWRAISISIKLTDLKIIGGGTAGLTLADRLTANGSLTVAVIEAGSFYEISNSNLSQIPAFDFFSSGPATTGFNTLIDWGIFTTPQTRKSKCLSKIF